jgi:CRISPR-associated protein Cas2
MTECMILSGYRAVWIFAMFDLPTDTDKARKDYTHFRKNLLKNGFSMLQYSVYVRHCASEENADVHHARVKNFLPDDGEVRLIVITDKQFARMQTFWGKMRKPPSPQPRQLELF